MEEVKQPNPPQEKPVESPAAVSEKEVTEETLPKVYPGSGLNKSPARMMKIEEVVQWDMEFGVKVGPIGYDHNLTCPYCHRRMLLVSHEGSRYQKAIRILYQCEGCGAHTVVQFLTPAQKVDLPEMNLGEKIQIEKPTPVPNLAAADRGERSTADRGAKDNRDSGRKNRPEHDSETNQIERAERQAERPRTEKQSRPHERVQYNERSERPAGNRSESVARAAVTEHPSQNLNRSKNRQEERRPAGERPQPPAGKSRPLVTKLPGEQIKKLASETSKAAPIPAASLPEKRSNAYFRSRKTASDQKPEKPEPQL
ncbi:MAG: hypothetical protein LLG09_02945 [Negativicutes bacterium]|nr:hypothetical protein [Negativicutes bacterium]